MRTAVANWKLSTIPRALPPDQVEQVLALSTGIRLWAAATTRFS